MPVFDKVATPRIDLYDNKTNEYYGRIVFNADPNSERALLEMINQEKVPESIIAQDVTFFPTSSRYVPPGIFIKIPRNAVIRAEFRDADSKLWVPADIYVSLNARARGNPSEDKYHFDNVEYSDFVIRDIKILPQGGSPQI